MIVRSSHRTHPPAVTATHARRSPHQARMHGWFAIQGLRLLVLGIGLWSCLGARPVRADENSEVKNLETLVTFVPKLTQQEKPGTVDYCNAGLFLSVTKRPILDIEAVEFGKKNFELVSNIASKSSPSIQTDAGELKRAWEVVNEVLKRAKDGKFLAELNSASSHKIFGEKSVVLDAGSAKEMGEMLGKADPANTSSVAIELLNKALNHAYAKEQVLAKTLPDEIRSRAIDLLLVNLKGNNGKDKVKRMLIKELDAKLTVVDQAIPKLSEESTPRSLLAAAFEKWAKEEKASSAPLIATIEDLDQDLKQHVGMPVTIQGILQGVGEKYGLKADQSVRVVELEGQVKELIQKADAAMTNANAATAKADQLEKEKAKLASDVGTLNQEKTDWVKKKGELQASLAEKENELARRPPEGRDSTGTDDKNKEEKLVALTKSEKDHVLNLIIGGIGLSMVLITGVGMYLTQVRPAKAKAKQISERAIELLTKLREAETQVAEQKQRLDRVRIDPGAREKQLAKEKQQVEKEFGDFRRTAEAQLQNHPAAQALAVEQKRTESLKSQVALLQSQIQTLSAESNGHRSALEQLQVSTEQWKNQIRRHEGTVEDYKKQVLGLGGQIEQRDARINELGIGKADLDRQLQDALAAAKEKEESIQRMEQSLLPSFLGNFPGLRDLLRSDSSEWKAVRGRFQVLNALLQSGDKVLFMDELKVLGRSVQQLYRNLGAPEAASKDLVAVLTGWARQTFSDLKVEVPDIGEKFDDNRMINLSRQRGSEVSAVASWIIWEGAQRKFAGEVETIL